MNDPDSQHLKEYNKYLEILTLQDLLNLTADEKAIRNFRIQCVKNCIENLKSKQK